LTEGKPCAHYVWLDVMAAYLGVEWRFPYLDRRLVDFVIAIPPKLCFREGMSKFILREALRGLLPEKVRRRTTGSHFGASEERGLRETERRRIVALLKDPVLVRLGYVDERELRSAWELYWRQGGQSGMYRPLTAGLCVEAWLRKRAAPKAAQPGPGDLA